MFFYDANSNSYLTASILKIYAATFAKMLVSAHRTARCYKQEYHITWEIRTSPAFISIWMCSDEGFVDTQGECL